MFLNRVLAIAMLILSPIAAADSLDINMNNTVAQFKFNSSASEMIEGNSALTGGLLYNDAGTLFLEGGLLVRGGGEESEPGVSLGVGAKAVFGSVPKSSATNNTNVNGSAIGVGGELTLAFPTESRVALVMEYFGSPKIMSFGEAERFSQFGLRFEVEVSPQARVYIGYREIGFGIKQVGSVTLDKSNVMGVVIMF